MRGQGQFSMGLCKGAPQKTLGSGVHQEPGQAGVKLTAAVDLVGLFHPEAASGQRVHRAKVLQLAAGQHLVNEYLPPHARHIAGQQVSLCPGCPHFDHLAGGEQGREQARDRGLAHAQLRLQLGATAVAVVTS